MGLSNHKFKVSCSNCGRSFLISLADFRRGKTHRCTCGTNIKLKDDNGQAKAIEKSFKDFERTIKNLGFK